MTQRVRAVLEVMWGWRGLELGDENGEAPRWYHINSSNYSGKMLYKWLGHKELLVTNACKEYVRRPIDKGKPDPSWLETNLIIAAPKTDLLLVCGKVAKETYLKVPKDSRPTCRTIFTPHPAWRMWSNVHVDQLRILIESGTKNSEFIPLRDNKWKIKLLLEEQLV